MPTRVMSELLQSQISLLQSMDDKNKSCFDALQAKIDGAHDGVAKIRAELTDTRKDVQSMSKKLDETLHVLK